MNIKEQYPILFEAYEHYQKTRDSHYDFLPKNPDYVLNAINAIPCLLEYGYVDNVSDNLLDNAPISLSPLEHMCFDITLKGIQFVESGRE